MQGSGISFETPWALSLLLVLPVFWLLARHSLSGLGRGRGWVALGLRSVVVALLIFALAGIQWRQTSDRMAVLYVVDRSQSVEGHSDQELIRFLETTTRQQRNSVQQDQAGVVVFGRKAAVEIPLVEGELGLVERFESQVDAEATDLADALKLGQAILPAGASKRIVVLSDGNQNLGDAQQYAQRLASAGIGIDVVPLKHFQTQEVALEEVVLPSDVRQDAPFEGRVVLRNISPGSASSGSGDSGVSAQPATGRLRVTRSVGEHSSVILDQPVTLQSSRHVFTFNDQLELPGFYTYDAQFVPDDPSVDQITQNNRSSAFTHIRGRGAVLLIEPAGRQGEFAALVERIRQANFDVTIQNTDRMFSSLADLQSFDVVVMADVPRFGDWSNQTGGDVSDRHAELLARNVQQLGAGLVVIGGPDSFGAGGWVDSPLEKAMPVDFNIKNTEAKPPGALMLVIDRSGSMSGDNLMLSKAAAVAALRTLSDHDYIGVVTFDTHAYWAVPMQKIEGNRNTITRQINSIDIGGGTDLQPGMTEGYRGLISVDDVGIRHMIVLTDGQTPDSGLEAMAQEMSDKLGITTTGVAVGAGADQQLMQRIARAGNGQHYFVDDPMRIPQIFMKEAQRIAHNLIYEDLAGIGVQKTVDHVAVQGIDGEIPAVTGFVMTTPKSSPLVEIPLQANLANGRTNVIAAYWQYGIGKTAVITTDSGQRWATPWLNWDGYDQLIRQTIYWAMRPTEQNPDFALFTQVRDGQVELVVSAVEPDGSFLNFLDVRVLAVGPKNDAHELVLKQQSPGRYVGAFPASNPGNYILTVVSPGRAPLRGGVNVPYSSEFEQLEPNWALLQQLAAQVPEGAAEPGTLVENYQQVQSPDQSEVNFFRRNLPKAISLETAWPLVVFLASCMFFADVFNRRVWLSLDWLRPMLQNVKAKVFRKSQAATIPTDQQREQTLGRLRESKSEVQQRYQTSSEANKAQEPYADDFSGDLLEALKPVPTTRTQPRGTAQNTAAPAAREESYTERLLKAKRQVQSENIRKPSDEEK